MSNPVPRLSVPDIRDTFTRMNMDDRWDNLISKSWPLLIPRETVALIGGGHAFGKTHGACTKGAGPKPVEDPVNPWPGEHHASYCDNVSPSVWPSLSGMCGSGKLGDAFTSGFEFPFTSNPTRWDNEYFVNLEHYQVWNMIFNLIWGRVKLSAVFLMWILSKIFSGRNIWDQAVISNGRCHHQPPSSSSKHHYHHHPHHHHHHLHHSQHWIRLLVNLLQHLPQISPGLRTSGCSPRKLSIVTIVVVIVVIIIIITIFIAILNLIVMTSRDVALLEDPIYLSYVQLFASSMLEFDEAFASAWWVKSFWWRWHCWWWRWRWHCWWRLTQPRYKLTTRDMGPHSRCIGPIVPPPQPWQVGHDGDDKTMRWRWWQLFNVFFSPVPTSRAFKSAGWLCCGETAGWFKEKRNNQNLCQFVVGDDNVGKPWHSRIAESTRMEMLGHLQVSWIFFRNLRLL